MFHIWDMNPYMERSDPVPGLGRGLAILDHLGREGACSLERLAKDLQLPKSSTARILESLTLAGCVLRDPHSKRYSARRVLVAAHALSDLDLRTHLASTLVALAAQTGRCVELFAWVDRRLVMIDRADPEDQEVVVRARIGWVRPLDEVDALVQLAIAHGGLRPPAKGWRWAKAERVAVPPETAARLAARAASAGIAHDLAVNTQGVVRVAAPLLASGRLVGVLALASPAATPADADACAALHAAAAHFSTSHVTVAGAPIP